VCRFIYLFGTDDDFLAPKYCSTDDFAGISICPSRYECADFLTSGYVRASTTNWGNLSILAPRCLGFGGFIFKNRQIFNRS
jgi:hypothetical protein